MSHRWKRMVFQLPAKIAVALGLAGAAAFSSAAWAYPSDMPKYIQDKKNQAESAASSVSAALPAAATPNPGQYHLGADPASVMMRWEMETDWYKTLQYQMCNMGDLTRHLHSYADIHQTRPRIIYGPCYEYHMYVGKGMVSGICKKGIKDIFCGCYWIYADAIDYLEPTQKITISNQPFYSRYVDKITYQLASLFMKQYLQLAGPILSVVTMNAVDLAALTSLGMQPPSGAWGNMANIQFPEYWMRTNDRSYVRLLPESLVQADDHEWIPHLVAQQPPMASDIQWAPQVYWLTLAFKGTDHLQDMGQGNPRCLRNNEKTGKTPKKGDMIKIDNNGTQVDLSPQNVDMRWSEQEEKWDRQDSSEYGHNPETFKKIKCLSGVGEIDPFVANRRPHQTDAFFQTFVRGLKWYDEKVKVPKRQSFDLSRDKFHFIPGMIGGQPEQQTQKMIDDMGVGPTNCLSFDEIVPSGNSDPDTGREAHEWPTANTLDFSVHGETTVTLFTRFSGCVDFKGRDAPWWMIGCFGSGVYREPGYPPSKWMDNQLRIK